MIVVSNDQLVIRATHSFQFATKRIKAEQGGSWR